jgi:murein DD-endopeptidase MepM/ murein hydrolase activator NlpD
MRVACLLAGLLWAFASTAEVLYRVPWPEGLSFTFTQVPGGRITTHFTKATLHAVDIAMPVGVPVLAARSGVVEALESGLAASAEDDPVSYEGNFVRVRHEDGSAATYAHLRHLGVVVERGEAVRAGQVLGQSGDSGDVLKPHLHFAVTRMRKNSSGWWEEVSVPVTFYVGVPPVPFTPRPALKVTSNYSSAAEPPRTAGDYTPLAPWKRAVLAPDEEAIVWAQLALWLAAGLAGMAWFWSFSRRP